MGLDPDAKNRSLVIALLLSMKMIKTITMLITHHHWALELHDALLLVFANKQDFKMMVMNIIEITDMLGLRQINPYSSFKIEDHFYSVWTLEHPDHHLM